MQAYVRFILEYLLQKGDVPENAPKQESSSGYGRAITLHAFPIVHEEGPPDTRALEEEAVKEGIFQGPPEKKDLSQQITAVIPRIISLAEIVKREFVAKAGIDQATGTKRTRTIFQYNEGGSYQPRTVKCAEETQKRKLAAYMEGNKQSVLSHLAFPVIPSLISDRRNSLKMHHIPYMTITLSTVRLPTFEITHT